MSEVSEDEKRFVAKILMRNNVTRYVGIDIKKIRDIIVRERKALKGKDKLLKGSMLPLEMWAVKVVLEDDELMGSKPENIACIEVREKKKGEQSVVTGLA